MYAPTLPSTFLAVQGVGLNTSRAPQLMNAIRSIPAVGAALASAQRPPLSMPQMKDGGLLVTHPADMNRMISSAPGGGQVGGYQQPTNQEAANNGDTSWLSLFSGLGVGGGVDQSASTSGDIQGPSAPGPTTQQINAYITLYGQQEPLKSSANPGALARQALMSDPNTLKEVNDSIAELARVRARTGTDAGSGNAIEVEKLRNEFLYANMQQTAENERLTRESTAAQSALTRGDTRAQADQVAAHNREQLILDWHKSQLMAEDNARTAAETAQRDKQSAFLGLLPYGHAPGFNVGTYRQGQSLPEYTVTAPAWVDPSIQNTQIAQPNIPAITWPGGPSGPGPSGPGGY